MTPDSLLRAMFDRAVAVADPMESLAGFLPPRPAGRVVVVGAGKASARMAEAVEAAWGPCEGLVITRYGHARPTSGIEIVEAAHPVPDQAGVDATLRMLALLDGLGEDDFVLALISGGASALLCAPAGNVSLAEKQQLNRGLLASGAPIGQMNLVRKHLSRVKGGQLAAAAWPAPVLTLMISDVPGDEPALIGSGPTVGDRSTAAEVRAILDRWGVTIPASVDAVLRGGTGVRAPDDPAMSGVRNIVYAAPSRSLVAAAELAATHGFDVEILGDSIEGEAREVAADHARMALSAPGPRVILSGGELTVTRRGDGCGGPNAEYALALALALDGAAGIHALACDTDGIDGAAEIAGAVIGPETLARARACGADAQAALTSNDAHGFFARIGGQVITGPTLTNVNDFRALLIE
ncbi:glycerate kinase type-2 family protein [Paracoccus alkenifer]|uniref:Hydroxypyruvate reductase n=1 Tax=Paracoccus alkenifer TaxID=65735 RepID=A0A1H6JSQ4_9RHOB|nr:glycerate kinase [Paracoccus alkenifer]SEH65538.1 hydroxypyruvate reductase [Paracoccus alkenifer]